MAGTIRNTCTECLSAPDADGRFCLRCEKHFISVRADARYCSPGCRQAAYRQRKENSLTVEQLLQRRARLEDQIQRDGWIAGMNSTQYYFDGFYVDSPKRRCTRFYGAGFFAAGRQVQAQERLKAVIDRLRVLGHA